MFCVAFVDLRDLKPLWRRAWTRRQVAPSYTEESLLIKIVHDIVDDTLTISGRKALFLKMYRQTIIFSGIKLNI
jgi:hypothetical protein